MTLAKMFFIAVLGLFAALAVIEIANAQGTVTATVTGGQPAPSHMTVRSCSPNEPCRWLSPSSSHGFGAVSSAVCDTVKDGTEIEVALATVSAVLHQLNPAEYGPGTQFFLSCYGAERSITIP